MRVTIIADASIDHEQKVGGYAFWAVSERGRHAGEGVFKGAIDRSDAAEMMAIVNALHMSIALEIARKSDEVLIQTDCRAAITLLSRPQLKERDASIVRRFRELRDSHDLKIEFRWVQGHSKTGDARSRAQRSADIRARRVMRKARSMLATAGVK